MRFPKYGISVCSITSASVFNHIKTIEFFIRLFMCFYLRFPSFHIYTGHKMLLFGWHTKLLLP